MAITNLFSKRTQPKPNTLVYDDIPSAARLACHRILGHALSTFARTVDEILISEHPMPSFGTQPDTGGANTPWRGRVAFFFERCLVNGTFPEAMDAIEAGAMVVNRDVRWLWDRTAPSSRRRQASPDDALAELNHRLAEYGVGYLFSKEQGRLVRVDSTFMQTEVTQPAMVLLAEKEFRGAAEEFAEAHQHYRRMAVDPNAGKDAVAWAVKAVESTAKVILNARRWEYDKNATVVPLLDALFTKGLVPAELQSFFGGLRSALTSGLPAIGNRQARHGQGAEPRPIEEHMVTLGMHLAAATIRFLVEAHKARVESRSCHE